MRAKVYGTAGVLCIMLIIFVFCENKEKQQNTGEIFWRDFIFDDSTALQKVLTKEYDIKELKEFFENKNENELPLRPLEFKNRIPFNFDIVNEKFPVEVVRTSNYSVYKVKQGGYFYVFWVDSFEPTDPHKKSSPGISFSVYLTSERPTLESFDTIILGESTAEDVRKIDPGFWLSFAYRRSGPYSYSYLNADSVLEIEYEWPTEPRKSKKDHTDYEDLVVVGKKVLPRTRGKNQEEIRPSVFSRILEKDLPVSRNDLILRRVCIGAGIVAVSAFVAVMVRRKKRRPEHNLSSET